MSALDSELDQIEQLLTEWRSTPEQCSHLYRVIANALEAEGRMARAFELQKRHLSRENSAATAEDASRCILLAIRTPEVYEMEDMLRMRAVAALQGQPLHALLRVFVEGSFDDFTAFAQHNYQTMQSLACGDVRRRCAFRWCRWGSLEPIPHRCCAACVDEAEVESWVVQAVAAGPWRRRWTRLAEGTRASASARRGGRVRSRRAAHSARTQAVVERRAAHLGDAQWRQLHQRLTVWAKNLTPLRKSARDGGGRDGDGGQAAAVRRGPGHVTLADVTAARAANLIAPVTSCQSISRARPIRQWARVEVTRAFPFEATPSGWGFTRASKKQVCLRPPPGPPPRVRHSEATWRRL